MTRSLTRSLALLVLLFALSAAAAAPFAGVRLHNRDSRSYKLYVKHRSSAVHTSIGAGTVTNICSAACTIRVEDTGSSLDASPGDKVVIQDGTLRKK